MTDTKIVKNLILHQEGKHLPDELYQQLADEIGTVIDQDLDQVVEKLMEEPSDRVFGPKKPWTDCMECYLYDREFASTNMHSSNVKRVLKKGHVKVILPFTTKDGVRFLPEEN